MFCSVPVRDWPVAYIKFWSAAPTLRAHFYSAIPLFRIPRSAFYSVPSVRAQMRTGPDRADQLTWSLASGARQSLRIERLA